MKILGFNFTKIHIEKKKDFFKELKINSEVNVSDIKEVKQDILKSKGELLGIKFRYGMDYSPDIAKIEIEGDILASVELKIAKEVLKKWKNKETPDEFKIPLFNLIFKKAGLKALELEDEMNLPLHIQMPTIRKKEESSDK
jgi:hypothetical protein